MTIPLGILAAAGVRAAGGSYELIETITVGSGGAASVTFSNLNTYSSTYQHFQIRWVAKSTRSGQNSSDFFWQINGDTTQANYRAHQLRGNGSNVASSDYGSGSIYYGAIMQSFPGGNYTNEFAAGVTDILDPFESKNKTVRTLRGANVTWYDGSGDIGLTSGVWLSTASMTSFTFKDRLANIAQNSRFSIYGLKAS